ncbi:MAG TPA: hypothetical protein VFQ54_01625 [Thermomicrobiales bacterium]|nr:hypothetical protein [Thermomicrobiales bacterium]
MDVDVAWPFRLSFPLTRLLGLVLHDEEEEEEDGGYWVPARVKDKGASARPTRFSPSASTTREPDAADPAPGLHVDIEVEE